jgi:putative aldouronate transport system permease protein
MLLPGIAFFLIYRYLPMYGVIMAFQDFRLSRGFFGSKWVGLQNFNDFFTSAFFPLVMRNTILISFLKLLVGFPAPIILALMLNECRNQAFKRTIQTVVYLPHFISWVVLGNLVSIFFGVDTGLIPQVLNQWFGWNVRWLVEAGPFRVILVLSDVWKGIGWGSIIYLAALTGIDPTLYEAAYIDGAKKFQLLFHITLPVLLPLIATMLILRVGGILDAGFEQIFILQNSMVYRSSEIIDTYSYSRGFVNGEYGFGAAVGLFKSVIGLVMVLGANYFSRKYGEGGLI